ncbi:MAG: hypothetical protein IIC72_02965 [Acidobacteria bacterium]|nr:hypothetical protein [Acidobacteriota bacterium]TDI52672.1 MAG: hypothetical protein E2O97_02165 [Acidobacteriota bacterium]TDI56849.1 MAG: hypothetical protein E2O96_01900 [Acidobacteriota bacterium]
MTRLDLGDGLRLLSQVMTEEHFGHESHLRFAWALLDEAASVEKAEHVANLTIRHVTEIGGNPGKYNCTVTIFWIRLLAHVREKNEGVSTLDEAFESWPDLLDPHLPDLYWSDVNSVEAKRHWVEPDLVPMP